MTMEILQWILIGLSAVLLVALVAHTRRRARALSDRIDEYHAEQEAKKNQPGPIDPYADMAGLFGSCESDDAEERKPGS